MSTSPTTFSAATLPRSPCPMTPGASSTDSSPSGSPLSGSPLRESPQRQLISSQFERMISQQNKLFHALVDNKLSMTETHTTGLVDNIRQLQQETLAAFDAIEAQKREVEANAYFHLESKLGYEKTNKTFQENFIRLENLHKELQEKHTKTSQELADVSKKFGQASKQLDFTTSELADKERLLAEEKDKASKLSESFRQVQESEKALISGYDRAQKSNAELEESVKTKEACIADLEKRLREALFETGKTRVDLAALQKELAELKNIKGKPNSGISTSALPKISLPPVSPRERQLNTWKKVAYVAIAILIVVALGAAVYFLFPSLVASGLATVSQIWKYVLALSAKVQQAPLVNPAIYALRGRLGV